MHAESQQQLLNSDESSVSPATSSFSSSCTSSPYSQQHTSGQNLLKAIKVEVEQQQPPCYCSSSSPPSPATSQLQSPLQRPLQHTHPQQHTPGPNMLNEIHAEIQQQQQQQPPTEHMTSINILDSFLELANLVQTTEEVMELFCQGDLPEPQGEDILNAADARRSQLDKSLVELKRAIVSRKEA